MWFIVFKNKKGHYGNNTAIFLYSNQFTRFDSDAFQPILEKIARYGGPPSEYLRIDQSNSFYNSTE